MKKNIKEMDVVDIEELQQKLESEAGLMENAYLRILGEVPVFNFELNWYYKTKR